MLTLPPRSRGFTLVEMAITLAILGFLLAAALPSIGVWMDNTKIRSVAESIQNGIQHARAEAVRQNKSVSFWLVSTDASGNLGGNCSLDNTSGSWVVSVDSPIGQCDASPSTTATPFLVVARAAGESMGRVRVTSVQSDGTTAGTTLTFNPFGRVTNIDAITQVDVTGLDADTEYRNLRVLINSTGMVRMCDPRVTNTNDPRICPTAS